MTIKPIGGFDLGAFKIDALVNAPVIMKELQESAVKGIKRLSRMISQTPRGTQGKVRTRKWTEDRWLHPTKGFAKTERGGYVRRSRRGNGS